MRTVRSGRRKREILSEHRPGRGLRTCSKGKYPAQCGPELPVNFSPDLLEILVCPFCAGALADGTAGYRCAGCGEEYPITATGQPNLRLRKTKPVTLQFPVGEDDFCETKSVEWQPLKLNPNPAVDFSGLPIPNHLSREMMSYFPKAQTPGARVLDLGCGPGIYRAICERAGFAYVGLDYDNAGAPLLGDAHALPFRDASFEFILSLNVLEHIRYPAVMLGEAFRVLRSGGIFLGSVSFQEPFHEISYQHHSHMAVWSGLRHANFDVLHIAPGWDGLTAQAQMALFPGCPSAAIQLVTAPLRILHRIWWQMLAMLRPGWSELHRRQIAAGAFTFIARKP